jgi:hypothetical protein
MPEIMFLHALMKPLLLFQALLLLFMLTISGNMIFTVIIRPSIGILTSSIAIGMGVGLAFGLLYYRNVQSKIESCRMVSA